MWGSPEEFWPRNPVAGQFLINPVRLTAQAENCLTKFCAAANLTHAFLRYVVAGWSRYLEENIV